MNLLKAKKTIHCRICGAPLVRRKTFRVLATEKKAAIEEADQKVREWCASLKGATCAICRSILNDVEGSHE